MSTGCRGDPRIVPASASLVGMEVFTTTDLLAKGLTPKGLRRLVTEKKLVRLSRGFYEVPVMDEHRAELIHLARAEVCRPAVLALESAALVHGLPLLRTLPDLVQTVEPGDGRSWKRGLRQIRSAPLPDDQTTVMQGFSLTTAARTVVDLTRLRGLEPGLVSWEAARWRARVDEDLEVFDAAAARAVDLLAGRAGITRARRALDVASAWSQSPMETRSLLAITGLGLPAPVQQFEVCDRWGRLLGITDFAWPELGVLGEYDGEGKCQQLAHPNETPRDVLRSEKRRQESMEAEGWVFARWGKEEVARPRLLSGRITSAFSIAQGRSILGRPDPLRSA